MTREPYVPSMYVGVPRSLANADHPDRAFGLQRER
jgi:hypothetical protein